MENKPKVGIWNVISNTYVVSQIAAYYDFVLLDLEHGFRDFNQLESQIRLIRSSPAELLVRVRSFDDLLIQSLLDLGVSKFLVPQIRDVNQVIEFAKRVHFPPVGTRGFHPKVERIMGIEISDFDPGSMERIEIYPLIETKESVNFIDSLLEMSFVSGCYIGTYDLSRELSPGNLSSPEIEKVIEAVASVSKKLQKSVFFMPRNHSDVGLFDLPGFDFLVAGIDSEIISKSLIATKVQSD
jgi:4-hydroxy-2-oxoheptanedioate aldolase